MIIKVSIAQHMADIKAIWQKQVPLSAALIVDHAMDWDWRKSLLNFVYYGKLWKEAEMDIFVVTGYAPKNSEFNPIEHLWSPLSSALSGVILPDELSPTELEQFQNENSTLPDDVKEDAQLRNLFDLRASDLAELWTGLTWDGYPITSHSVASSDCLTINKEYKHWKKFSKASTLELKSGRWKTEIELTHLLMKHCDKRENLLCFSRCFDPKCTHCSTLPVRTISPVLSIINNTFHGRIPGPAISDTGHYPTYCELAILPPLSCDPLGTELKSEKYGFCSMHHYYYSSKSDRDRHQKFAGHGSLPPLVCGFLQPSGKISLCLHYLSTYNHVGEYCDIEFPSRKERNKHQKETGHLPMQQKKRTGTRK